MNAFDSAKTMPHPQQQQSVSGARPYTSHPGQLGATAMPPQFGGHRFASQQAGSTPFAYDPDDDIDRVCFRGLD